MEYKHPCPPFSFVSFLEEPLNMTFRISGNSNMPDMQYCCNKIQDMNLIAIQTIKKAGNCHLQAFEWFYDTSCYQTDWWISESLTAIPRLRLFRSHLQTPQKLWFYVYVNVFFYFMKEVRSSGYLSKLTMTWGLSILLCLKAVASSEQNNSHTVLINATMSRAQGNLWCIQFQHHPM